MIETLSSHAGHALCWDGRRCAWRWAGTPGAALHAFDPDTRATLSCTLPDPAALLVPCRSGRLLAGLPKRLCLAEPGRALARRRLRVQPLAAVDPAEPGTVITAGCTDRRGFLLLGTGTREARMIGSFYQFSLQFGLRRLALPVVGRAGSLCVSADGRRLYFADSALSRIMQCDYDAERAAVGAVSEFAALPAGLSARGAVLDLDGCLWSAQGSRLARYSPDGELLAALDIDCETPAFGGARRDQLAVAGATGITSLKNVTCRGFSVTLFDDHALTYAI